MYFGCPSTKQQKVFSSGVKKHPRCDVQSAACLLLPIEPAASLHPLEPPPDGMLVFRAPTRTHTRSGSSPPRWSDERRPHTACRAHTDHCTKRNTQTRSLVFHFFPRLTCQTRLQVDRVEYPGRIFHSEGWCRPKRTRLCLSPLKTSDLWFDLFYFLHPRSLETGVAVGPTTLPAQVSKKNMN